MRRRWWLAPVLCTVRLGVAHAQACLPTAEAAAHSVIGSPAPEVKGTTGYRVQDVHVDPMTHRMWVRVGQCGLPGAPLILVPLHATLSGVPVTNAGTVHTLAMEAVPAAPFTPPHPFAVHAGDAVMVTFASSAVQMELEGTAEQAAALGDTIGISLRRRGDEPLHRMRGILRADHRVEVRQ